MLTSLERVEEKTNIQLVIRGASGAGLPGPESGPSLISVLLWPDCLALQRLTSLLYKGDK